MSETGPGRGLLGWLRARLDPRAPERLLGALVYGPLDQRLRLDEALAPQLQRPMPASAPRRLWCMGGIAFLLILSQFATGLLLCVYYRATPAGAYASVRQISEVVPLGWLMRGLHVWGSRLIVLAVLIHLAKVFVNRAYRPPRELTWLAGCLLLLLTLGFAFTGLLLPWDQRAFWSATAGTANLAAVPLLGPPLAALLRGGSGVSDASLARCFLFHVVYLPWLMVVCLAAHFAVIRRLGISEPL